MQNYNSVPVREKNINKSANKSETKQKVVLEDVTNKSANSPP